MRKASLIVIQLLLCALLFAGGAQEAAQQAGATSGQKVEIDSSSFQWGEPGYRLWWQEITVAFHKEYPNITVKGNDIPYGDYWDQMTVRLQAGNPPDILLMGGSLHPYIVLGKFEPLDDYLKGTGILERYSPGHQQYCSRDGHIYSLPYLTLTYGIFYNKAMFSKAALTVPKSVDELINTAKKLVIRDSGGNVSQYGYSILTPPALYEYYEFLGWANAYGAHFSKNNKVALTSPAVLSAAKSYKALYDSGATPKQSTMEGYRQLFWERKAAMVFDVVGFAGYVKESQPDLLPDLDSFIVPGGNGLVLPFGMVMAKDSKHKAEVWKFFQYAAQPQWQNRMLELSSTSSGLMSGKVPEAAVAGKPWMKAHLQMATTGSPIPPPGLEVHLERFRRAVTDALAQVLFENRDPALALQDAQAKLEAQINQ